MKNIKTYGALLNESAETEMLNWELLLAAEQLDVDEMKRLIDMGADPNSVDYYKQTPLHVAINTIRLNPKKKKKKITKEFVRTVLQLLLSAGADPNNRTINGTTPVLSAAMDPIHGANVLEMLLAAGAKPNVPTDRGFTPMKRALGYYNTQFIVGLMRAGVNIMDEFKNIDELSGYFNDDLSWIPEDLMEKIKRMQKGKSAFGM